MLSKLALVKDEKVKSGGCIFAVRSNGDIIGHKQQKGYKIPKFDNDLKSSIVFITCPNQKVVGKHSIGFCSFDQKFVDMKDGALEDISMILVKGMVHEDGVVKVVFHRWTGQINMNLQEEIVRYKSNAREFIQQFFSPVPEAVCIDNIDIHYVNQMLGSRLNEWSQEKSVYLHEDGHYYYEAKMQPDTFCKRDPFPESKRYEFLKPPRNRVKIGDTTFQTANDETGKYIGDPALRLHNNSTTQVIYGLRQDNTSALGNFNKPIVIKDKDGKDKKKIVKPLLQTMPTLPGDSNSKVKLAPISKDDRALLAKKCIAEGGLSSETFISEVMKCTNKYGAEPIEVHKIGLNKVRISLSFQCHIYTILYKCIYHMYVSYCIEIICI